MAADDPLLALLACPRCDRAPLKAAAADGLVCAGCKTTFPRVGGVPWLFADPDTALGEWRGRLHLALKQLAHESQRLAGELGNAGLRASTRRRLEHHRQALDEHRAELRRLLAPVDVVGLEATYETHLALRTRLPTDQGINTYYANVHRDWGWGDEENEASLVELLDILKATGGEKIGNTAVLGAGACRLAYDLHRSADAGLTAALDFNPLLVLIAQHMAKGDALELYEFPLAPLDGEHVAVLRRLDAPEPADPGFRLLLGDVLRPPFAPGSLDTVVTPWLIDVVGEDLAVFAVRVNRLLKSGGRWVNFGSLSFDDPERAHRYGPNEVCEVVAEAGFASPETHETTIPYMCSPASRHGRQETVFTFAAVKEEDGKAPPRHKALPDWIVLGKEPVPLLPAFQSQAMSTRIYAFIMSMIDGKRSIEDMARLMEQQKLMPEKEAVAELRRFLTRMYEDSRRDTRL